MLELQSFANSLGYNVSNFILDGVVHRFKHQKSHKGWYVGSQSHTTSGDPYITCTMGDWSSGAKETYTSKKKFSVGDKAEIKRQIDLQKKKSDVDKKVENSDVSIASEKMWNQHQFMFGNEHPYLRKKKISGDFGIKCLIDFDGDTLLIPMRDTEDKIWGIQKIQSNGSKWFTKGQRINGCFHTIGSIDEATPEAFLVEGFATGASIHMATDQPVVVSFNTANIHKVAKDLVLKYPGLSLKVAGDDDRYTIDKKTGKQINAGKIAAQKAGGYTQIKPVFPMFKEPKEGLTDFNDLHAEEGIKALKDQLLEKVFEKDDFSCLGYDDLGFYFYRNSANRLILVRSFTTVELFQLAEMSYWSYKYPSKTGIDWDVARDDLIQQSTEAGIFDASRVRGCGVWLDNGKALINTGKELIVNGKNTIQSELKSNFVYVKTKTNINKTYEAPLDLTECKLLTEICSQFKWEDENSQYYLAGWLAIARIAGALPVRPHIWVSAKRGGGKSILMDRFVNPCLGDESTRLFVQGGTTEAGIRQTIKSDSVPIIFDELELNDNNKHKNQAILQLMRQSWSQTGGTIIKGSSGGNAINFSVNFACLVASIRVSLQDAADKSRFTVLELSDRDGGLGHWDKLESLISQVDEQYGERLFARSCDQMLNINKSYKIFQKILAGKVSARFGQQHGMLLAGYWSLIDDNYVDTETAKNLVDELGIEEEKQNEIDDSDENDLLNHILTTRVSIQSENDPEAHSKYPMTNVVDTIEAHIKNPLTKDGLRQYGIWVGDGFLKFSNSHTELGKILSKTKWPINWHLTFRRFKGFTNGDPKRFSKNQGSKTQRYVQIPYKME